VAYDHDGCEAVHPEGQQDESGGVGQIRAESAGQDEVTDADRDEDRPQDDAGPGESVLQPAVGSPEVSRIAHCGPCDGDQAELRDDEPVRWNPGKPTPDLEHQVGDPGTDDQRRQAKYSVQFGRAPDELSDDQDCDPNRDDT